MCTIYFIRHGETIWNIERRMQGHKNSNLTDFGIEQMKWAADALKNIKFEKLYTSDLERALQSAEIFKRIFSSDNLCIEKNSLLREINLGSWEGRKIEDVSVEDPESYRAFWQSPELDSRKDGESLLDIISRSGQFLKLMEANHNNQTVAAVSHALFIKAASAWIANKNIADFWSGEKIKPGSITVAEYENSEWKLLDEGNIAHYKSENSQATWFVGK